MNYETRLLKRKKKATIFVLTVSAKNQRLRNLVLGAKERSINDGGINGEEGVDF